MIAVALLALLGLGVVSVVCWCGLQSLVADVPRDPCDARERELVAFFKATTLAHPELTAVSVVVGGAQGIVTVSSTLMPWLSERWVYHHLAGSWRLIRIAH